MTGLRLRYGLASREAAGDLIVQAATVAACGPRALVLRAAESAPCAACHGSVACRARQSSGRMQHIAIDQMAAPNDSISLTIRSSQLARMSLLCYLFPPVAMLAGAGLAGAIDRAAGDGWALIGSIAGLMLSGVVLRLYDSRSGSGSWQVEPGFREPGPGSG